jgi:cellulose biosynthesis protein BcsQ
VIAGPSDPRCTVLQTVVPYATEVERMGIERRPVTDYVPRSPAGVAYEALWAEARAKVGGLNPVVDLDSLF